MKDSEPTFANGSVGIMFSDTTGVARVAETVAQGVDEIVFQFNEGQAYGYRDSNSKIVYYRTVYSNDMLRADRLEFRGEWKQSIKELNDLFKWE